MYNLTERVPMKKVKLKIMCFIFLSVIGLASQMIDRVTVSTGNHIEIDFNISLKQFFCCDEPGDFECHSSGGKIIEIAT